MTCDRHNLTPKQLFPKVQHLFHCMIWAFEQLGIILTFKNHFCFVFNCDSSCPLAPTLIIPLGLQPYETKEKERLYDKVRCLGFSLPWAISSLINTHFSLNQSLSKRIKLWPTGNTLPFPVPKILYAKRAQLCLLWLSGDKGKKVQECFQHMSWASHWEASTHFPCSGEKQVEFVLKYEVNVGFGSIPLPCFSRDFHMTSFLCVSMSEWTHTCFA